MHTPNGDGGPTQKFKRTCKIWLKIQGVRAHNSATSGSNVTKTFPRDVLLGRGVQVGTIFAEGPPPKIWEAKIRRDFKQLSTLIANISLSKIGNVVDQPQPLTRWAKKTVNFGPLTKKL